MGLGAEAPKIPLDKLYAMDIKEVPAEVRVTDMLDSYGRARLDALVYILEKVPETWEYVGKGRLSVSDQYSRAGSKSIRWDWKAGDMIRMKDLGVLTRVKLHDHLTSGVNEKTAPFELHVFQKDPLPANTRFNIYFKRTTVETDELKLVQLHYKMNFGGIWYKMGNNFVPKDRTKLPGSHNLKLIDAMPAGMVEPAENEIVLRAPTDVPSGTFYLDRLMVPASMPSKELVDGGIQTYLNYIYDAAMNKVEFRASPVTTLSISDIVTLGIPDKPIDPTTFGTGDSSYYGAFAVKPKVPERLTPEQQEFVDGLRNSYFKAPKRVAQGSQEYMGIEAQAAAILARDCVRQPDGRYKYRESINFSGAGLFFSGDRFSFRKHWKHLPTSIIHEPNFAELYRTHDFYKQYNPQYVRHLFPLYGSWFGKCPDSEPVEALMKAFLDWMKYQVVDPPVGGANFTGSSRHEGHGILDVSRDLIATFRGRDDQPYIDYLGNLSIWVGGAQTVACAVDPLPGVSAEFSGESFYYSLFFEPDDKKFFSLLTAARDSWSNMLSIVDVDRNDMIKPDYTYYHHGHVSYWGGNYHVHLNLAEKLSNTQIELEPEIRRNLAWYTTRYTFGALAMTSKIKAGQESTSGALRYRYNLQQNPGKLGAMDEPTPFSVDKWPSRTVFEYFYEMNWDEVPSAKKYLAGVAGVTKHHPQAVKQALYAEYPKLSSIEPQSDIHLSLNWTGATSYSTGLARVHVGSYNDKDPTPSRAHGRWSWNRGYGSLYISENDRYDESLRPPLGASVDGYSWSKAPGITMPAVTDEEYIRYHTSDGKTEPNPTGVELNSSGGPGNGSLTFNETEEGFGKYGNFSFQTLREENQQIWKLFNVDGLDGKKSYHFYKDKVVCLGSDYQANTERPMETILFQEATDTDINWKNKNTRRWNPEKPSLVLNGRKYEKDFKTDVPLSKLNYVISPYGHAWIIPGAQDGDLKLEWAERETLLNYRISETGLNPGKQMTKGTTVIAWLDHGPSHHVSSHHYCLLLNHDGKSPEELEAYTIETAKVPSYKVLRQDKLAHAVAFEGVDGESALFSYLIYAPGQEVDLPYVSSTNKRVNMMIQKNKDGNLVVSVCDPLVDIEKDKNAATYKYSYDREVKIAFKKGFKISLLSSTSGLPQTNPPLGAKMVDNVLSYTTRNGVTDTFSIQW